MVLDPALVRSRPGMYIGSTGSGMVHRLLWAVVGEGVAAALAGREVGVEVVSLSGAEIGICLRGVPTEALAEAVVAGSVAELPAPSVLGMHTAPWGVVSALCSSFRVEVGDGSVCRFARFEQGALVDRGEAPAARTTPGVTVTLRPDGSIFESVGWEPERIRRRLGELPLLVPQLTTRFREGDGDGVEWDHAGGLIDLVASMRGGKPLHRLIHAGSGDERGSVQVALQWTDACFASLAAFANTVHLAQGGTPATGLGAALARALQKRVAHGGAHDPDLWEGLCAAVSVNLTQPRWGAQTRTRLDNKWVHRAVAAVATDALSRFFEDHPVEAVAITDKISDTKRAHQRASQARATVSRLGPEHEDLVVRSEWRPHEYRYVDIPADTIGWGTRTTSSGIERDPHDIRTVPPWPYADRGELIEHRKALDGSAYHEHFSAIRDCDEVVLVPSDHGSRVGFGSRVPS